MECKIIFEKSCRNFAGQFITGCTLTRSTKNLCEEILDYEAFTDIVFNPQKSLNCQAIAAAIYVSLRYQNLLKESLKSPQNFLNIVYPK